MHKNKGAEKPPCFDRQHLEEHHRLYPAVHMVKLKEIEARLIRSDTAIADPTYCPIRSLKKEYAYALNSVRLHEYYFENLQANDSQPSTELNSLMERDFGSSEEWEKQFLALAICSRGWVILGFDLKEGMLRNYIADDHSEGVWAVMPIIVLDMYEHAYYAVFSSRAEYIKTFINCLNWEVINRRIYIAREVYKYLKEAL